MRHLNPTASLVALFALAVAFAVLFWLARQDRPEQDFQNFGSARESVLSDDGVETGAPSTTPVEITGEELNNRAAGSSSKSSDGSVGEARSTDIHAPVTERIAEANWEKIRARSGLSIQPRREFFSNPVPVKVAHAPLRAARDRAVTRLNFDLGMADPVTAEVGKVVRHSPGAYTIVGKIDGDPLSEFSVSVYEDAVVGTFQSADMGIRQLRFVGEEVHRVEAIDDSKAPHCAVTPADEVADISEIADADADGAGGGATNELGPSFSGGSPDDAQLDVLVAYTAATVANEGSLNALLALINQGVVDTNQAFQASGIEAQLRLVGTELVSYGGTDSGLMLSALRSTTDGSMDSLHSLRTSKGADFVSLWAPLSDACGRGYRMTTLSTSFASSAFNVCDPDCQYKFTFTHELGHNFGCHHAIGDSGLERGGSSLFPYSYGWRWNGSNAVQYRSMMAYSPGIRAKQFSDPLVMYQGAPAGSVNTDDNARSIALALDTLVEFRDGVDDHGDTAALATPVTENSSTPGRLEKADDVDWFEFFTNSRGPVNFGSSGAPDVGVRVWDQSMVLIGSDSDSGSGENFLAEVELGGGTYFIEVFGENGAIGDYSLKLNRGAFDDHGDSLITATPVALPGAMPGSLELSRDEDMFRLDVVTAGTLNITATGAADTSGWLYDSGGSQIAFDEGSGTTDFSITRILQPGVYYVKVKGLTVLVTGEYTLELGFVALPDDHGGSFSEATELFPGTLSNPSVTAGEFESIGDSDYFRFTIPAPGGGGGPGGVEEVLLDMNGPPTPGYGSFVNRTQLLEAGYIMRAPTNNFGHMGPGYRPTSHAYADNGTPRVQLIDGDKFEVVAYDGSEFDAISVDLSESTGALAYETSVTWVGHKANGSTVSQTFVTDGIIDGEGGYDDFETFSFSPDFKGIVRLEITTDRISLDNIALEVTPEPTGQLVVRSTGSSDTVGALHWPTLEPLQSDDNGGSGSNFAISRPISPGIYYLQVNEYGNNELGDYSISLGYHSYDELPPAPATLTATSNQDARIWVNWNDVPEASHYTVYRHTTDNATEATIIRTGTSSSSYYDYSVVAGVSYYYWVVSTNAAGESPFSDSAVGVSLHARPTITAQPEDTAVASGGDAMFMVAATANEGILSYQWYLGGVGDTGNPVGSDSAELVITNITAPATVWVRVSDDHRSVDSLSAMATVYVAVAPPDSVSASNGLSTSGITVRWLAVPGAAGYVIYRNTVDSVSGATQLGTTQDLRFVDSSAALGQDYFYFVRSLNEEGFEGEAGGGGTDQRNVGSLAAGPLDGTLLPVTGVIDFGYDEQGEEIFVSGEDGWVDRYSVADRNIDESVVVGPDLGGIDVDQRGQRILVAQSTATGGNGRLYRLSFIDGLSPQVVTYTVPLIGGENGLFDVAYVSDDVALLTTQTTDATSVMRQINADTGALTVRNDLPSTGGEVGSSSFFAKIISKQDDTPESITSYHNDFSGSSGDPLEGFTSYTTGSASVNVVDGALRIDLETAFSTEGETTLHIPSVFPGFSPQLASNSSLVTIAFNAWNEDQGPQNVFNFRLQNLSEYRDSANFGYSIAGGGYADDGMRGGFIALVRSPFGYVNRPHLNVTGGLATLPQIGAFRITFDPRNGKWNYFFEQSTSVLDPLEIDQLIASAVDFGQTDASLPFLNFFSRSKGSLTVDNLTIQLGGGTSRFIDLAVFHQRAGEAAWFGYDDELDSFEPERSNSSPLRYGAVNAIGNRYVVGDGVVTRAYDSDGIELASLPVVGDVSFSPITDQLYLIDAATGKLRIYSSVDWQPMFAVDIPGGVTADDSVFGQGNVKVRPDGMELAVVCNDGIRFIDLSPYLSTTAPQPPAELTASDGLMTGVELAWSRSVGVVGYSLYRSQTDDFSTAVRIANNLSSQFYEDIDAPANETLFYWVTAYSDNGESAPSLSADGGWAIVTPHSLSASTDISGQVLLTWQLDDGVEEGGFEIYRGITSDFSAAAYLAEEAVDSRNYRDYGASDGTEYYYWLRFKFGDIPGEFVGPAVGRKGLRPPNNLSVSDSYGSHVRISWAPIGGSLPIEYEIYADRNPGFDGTERLVGVTSANFIDDVWTNFPAYGNRYWAVRSVLPGESSSFTEKSGRRIMAPPTNFAVTVDAGDRLALTWEYDDDGQSGWEVFRSVTQSFQGASKLADLPATATSWQDPESVAGQVYFYWVGRVDSSPATEDGERRMGSGQRIGTRYSDFLVEHGLSGDDAIATNDPDGDGDATFYEWGLGGTDPRSESSRPGVVLREIQIGGDIYLTLCHLRIGRGVLTENRYDVQGLRYQVAGSDGLENWNLLPVAADLPDGLPSPPLGYEWACFRLPGSVEEYPSGFLKLKLTLLSP